jgi:beta-N-acetylhexosaminidase
MRTLVLSFTLILLCLAYFSLSCDRGDDGDDDDSAEDEDDDAMDDDVVDDDTGDDYSYPFCDIDEARIDALIAQMTLRRKIAQMYMVVAPVLPWFDMGDARRFVEEIGVGAMGVQPGTTIGLWPEWTVASINKIQGWAMGGELPIPVLVASDQEGGIPQAINNLTGGTDTPGNLGLGAGFDPEAAYRSYDIMGQQIAAVGINNAYSPVAGLMISPDEVSMYTRCFGEDTERVSEMVRQAVRGFQKNLVIATAKHFPSHSTAPGDEHYELIFNNESRQEVRSKYFPPFIAAIEAGVDMIMTTQAVYSAWGDMPATFTRELITDTLRDELGFDGIIISDDMNMHSITDIPWDEHPHVLAIAAGVDMVLDAGGDDTMFGMHPDNEQWAIDLEGQIDVIEAAVQAGRISESQINESVRRILGTKIKYCLFENPYRDPIEAQARIRTARQEQTARELHEAAITLVRNDAGLWPLDQDAGLRIHVVSVTPFQSLMYPGAHWMNLSGTTLLWEMRKLESTVTGDMFDVEPSDATIIRLLARAEAAAPDILVIGSYHGNFHERQKALIDGLLDLDIPTILVALAMPYDLMAFPDVSTYLATYSNRDIALETAARILFGLAEPGGRLPVTLPEMYDAGWSANQKNIRVSDERQDQVE